MNKRDSWYASSRYVEGWCFGAATAASAILVLVAVASEPLRSQLARNSVELGTIVAAILAAGLALRGVSSQVAQQLAIAEDLVTRKARAARATLPLALSELHEVCENRARFQVDQKAERKSSSWTISDTTRATIKECIELSDGNIQDALTEIPLILQILSARSRDIGEGSPMTDEQSDDPTWSTRSRHLIEWIVLRSLAESLFNWARGQHTEYSRPDLKDRAIRGIMWLSFDGWLPENNESFRRVLEEFKQHGGSFSSPDWLVRARPSF